MTDEPQLPHGLPQDSKRPSLAVAVAAVAFVVSVLGAAGFVVAYIGLQGNPNQTQLLGAALVVACGGLGVGLVVWAQGAMPQGPHVQRRHPPGRGPATRPDRDDEENIERDTREIGRRSLLGRLLVGALGAVGLSALVPFVSLGPREEVETSATSWRAGVRLVRPDGTPVRSDDVALGGAIPVLPEDSELAADSQVMLIRLAEDGQVDVGSGRRDWTVAGHVAYSRLCSHMGCSVGLYQVESRSLVCPCHQSAFRVGDGAAPEFGPATRALPQLPLAVDPDGFLVAAADFDRPVGAATWLYPERIEEGET